MHSSETKLIKIGSVLIILITIISCMGFASVKRLLIALTLLAASLSPSDQGRDASIHTDSLGMGNSTCKNISQFVPSQRLLRGGIFIIQGVGSVRLFQEN